MKGITSQESTINITRPRWQLIRRSQRKILHYVLAYYLDRSHHGNTQMKTMFLHCAETNNKLITNNRSRPVRQWCHTCERAPPSPPRWDMDY